MARDCGEEANDEFANSARQFCAIFSQTCDEPRSQLRFDATLAAQLCRILWLKDYSIVNGQIVHVEHVNRTGNGTILAEIQAMHCKAWLYVP